MDEKHASLPWLIAAVFLQMLPATVLAPAIRPLFAKFHGGAEGPMHAFMTLNTLGAIRTTPFIARLVVPAESRGRMMALVNTAGALGMLSGPMCGRIMVALGRTPADPLSACRNVFYLAGTVCMGWVLVQGPWLVKRPAIAREEHALTAQTTH